MTPPNCVLCGHPAANRSRASYPSPHADVLSSFAGYPSAETEGIRFKTDQMQAYMSRLDNETARLEAALRVIRSERETLEKVIYEHQSLIAPIRKLPIELLAKIFLSGNLGTFEKSKGPLLFISVCKRWRHVTNSTQACWSTLDLSKERYGHGVSPQIENVQRWLMQSGNHPLSVSWGCGDNEAHVFKALLSHRSRWQTIKLDLRPLQLAQLAAVTGPFPLLQKLELRSPSFELDQPLRTFEAATSLKEVLLAQYMTPAHCTLPWSTIPFYASGSSTIRECLYTLTHLTAVIDCDITCEDDVDAFSLPSSPASVTLLAMRALKLSSLDGYQNDLSALLDLVTVPSLQTLELDCSGYGEPEPQGTGRLTLLAMLTRSSCNLVRLKLHQLYITDIEVIAVLRVLPNLVDLEVKDCDHVYISGKTILTTMFLGALKMTTSGTLDHAHLIPNLRRLKLVGGLADEKALSGMIESRIEEPRDVTFASIEYARIIILSTKDEVQTLQTYFRERIASWASSGSDIGIQRTNW